MVVVEVGCVIDAGGARQRGFHRPPVDLDGAEAGTPTPRATRNRRCRGRAIRPLFRTGFEHGSRRRIDSHLRDARFPPPVQGGLPFGGVAPGGRRGRAGSNSTAAGRRTPPPGSSPAPDGPPARGPGPGGTGGGVRGGGRGRSLVKNRNRLRSRAASTPCASMVDSRAAPNRCRSRVRDGAAASAGIPPASAAGHSVVGPSVATEAAALEDDLSPWWWTHRPAPGAAIGEPFEHDSRTASGAGGRPRGAALESAPGRVVAARRPRRSGTEGSPPPARPAAPR